MLKSLLVMFAGPVGGLVNNAIGTASAASLTYLTSMGLPLTTSQGIVSGLALAASAAISWAAGTQGIVIPLVRQAQNGVTVVPATPANLKQAVNGPLK